MSRLRGECISPGVAVGPVALRGFDAQQTSRRIAADEVEGELNRLREALDKSRAQIEEIKQKQGGTLGEAELRIFDAHLSYLADAVFVTEIEAQVMNERLPARAAVQAVFAKYDRIFQLVESDLLRRRAGDLRDVATRLLRNLEASTVRGAAAFAGPHILVVRRLTTADMFNVANEKVEGIVAEEIATNSHAAILARSMGIPTLAGVPDVARALRDGDPVVLDATAGELVARPADTDLAEGAIAAQRWQASRRQAAAPAEAVEHATRDGVAVRLLGSCGSLGEAEMVRTFGMAGVGVFRTELQFLSEKMRPTEDALVASYRKVVEAEQGRDIAFRLLDVMAAVREGDGAAQERNPTMGLRGVRGLLRSPDLLRMQLRAILRAGAGAGGVGILVPFVTGLPDLQRVKAALLEERVALKKARVAVAEDVAIAPVIEVPAAAMQLGALLNESDFAVVAIDDLQAHLLAADRDNAAVREYHEMAHPAVFEMLARMAKDAERRDKPLVLFGESAADPLRVPFYLGVGFRSFSIAPVRLRGMLKVLRRYSLDECRRIAARILEAPRTLDVQKVLVNIETG